MTKDEERELLKRGVDYLDVKDLFDPPSWIQGFTACLLMQRGLTLTESVGLGTVVQDVINERHRQTVKWGGRRHDDRHGPGNWLTYIDEKLEKARAACEVVDPVAFNGGLLLTDYDEFRKRMVQVAALAVATVETLDRSVHPRREQ